MTSLRSQSRATVGLVVMAMFCIIPVLVSAGPGGQVSILFRQFANPNNQMYKNGRVQCCDLVCNWCEHYFDVCLKMKVTGRCVIQMTTKTYSSSKVIVFNLHSYLRQGYRNPLTYRFNEWTGLFVLHIDAKDYDTFSSNDQVDTFKYRRTVAPNPGLLKPLWYKVHLAGRVSSLSLSYSVQCNTNYYGPRCTVFCRSRDDSIGHYTCDKITGLKMCKSGWYGDACTVQCIPRDDHIRGHYKCQHKTGSKICLSGWHGVDCTANRCLSKNDSTAGYTCQKNGDRKCLKDWFGESCTIYCKSEKNGRYRCDVQTGNKICQPGWYGASCYEYCQAKDNSMGGYQCNTTTGKKVCLSGWVGPKCDCFSTDNDHAGYTCNSTTGARTCLAEWTGLRCDIRIATPTPDPKTCTTTADIGILLDSSASVGDSNFVLMKYFAATLVEQVSVIPPRFSIIHFSNSPQIDLTFNESENMTTNGLVKRILELKYNPGGTRTDKALKLASSMFTARHGARPGSQKLLIVLTDGKSSTDTRTFKSALALLKAANIQVIAVGIGGDVDEYELEMIALDKLDNVFLVPNFQNLYNALINVMKITCNQT